MKPGVFLFTALLSAALGACGGRVSPDDNSVPQQDTGALDSSNIDDGVPADDTATEDVPPGPRCKLSDGTPTCDVTGCGGCELGSVCAHPVRRVSEEQLPFGACLPSPTYGATCGACDATHPLCIALGTFRELTCVPESMCSESARLGGGDACFHSDKTPWRPGQAVPVPTCPTNAGADGLCGGACGGCSGKAACTGRSPRHPFGICADASATRCVRGLKDCRPEQRCLVHLVGPDGDQDLADNLGFCVAADRCKSISATLPGGAVCD